MLFWRFEHANASTCRKPEYLKVVCPNCINLTNNSELQFLPDHAGCFWINTLNVSEEWVQQALFLKIFPKFRSFCLELGGNGNGGPLKFLQISSWRFSGKVFVVVLGDSVCIACPSSHHQPLNNPEKNEKPFWILFFWQNRYLRGNIFCSISFIVFLGEYEEGCWLALKFISSRDL